MLFRIQGQQSGPRRIDTPFSGAPVIVSEAANANKRPDGVDARILVVDDDVLVRNFAVDCLTALGYRVVSAADGATAMDVLAEVPTVELVFTDIVMPGVDGIVLADMIKHRRPDIKILYATGYRDVGRAMNEIGVLHGKILEKPYRAAELAGEIQTLLTD